MTKIEFIQSKGYDGTASKEDWLKLMQEHGGTSVFGDEDEQKRIADLYTNDIDLFVQWFYEYTGFIKPDEE